MSSPRPISSLVEPHLPRKRQAAGLMADEQIHDGGGIGAAHAEIDDGDAVGGGVGHWAVGALDRHPVPVGEHLHVLWKFVSRI